MIAIPAAIGLFRADPTAVKLQILCSGLAFVAGPFFAAVSQGCAFFVMARRSEAEQCLQMEQTKYLNATHYPAGDPNQQAETFARARQQRNTSIKKRKRSDR